MAGKLEPGSPEANYRAAAGEVFRRLRTERNWSYREFGERVCVAHTSLYTVERHETTPAIDTLASVAAACDLTLIGRTLPPEEVADQTLAAIRAGDLYVITHDEALEPLRRRSARLEAAVRRHGKGTDRAQDRANRPGT